MKWDLGRRLGFGLARPFPSCAFPSLDWKLGGWIRCLSRAIRGYSVLVILLVGNQIRGSSVS
jgi:hypothetical protein